MPHRPSRGPIPSSWSLLAALVAIVVAAMPALAQTGPSPLLAPPSLPPAVASSGPLPGLPPGTPGEALQRLLDAGASRGPPPGLPRAVAPPASMPPAASTPSHAEDPLSAAESFFAARLEGPPLRQFGYDTFRHGPATAPAFGALPDDYVLGPDDEVILAFRGRARQTLTLRVGRDGALLLPDMPPAPAAGRTLAALRADLEARAARDLSGSEVFVSIGQVRQMNVLVAGEVLRPGFHGLNALASVLDALSAAGGVRKTGSLRAIRIEGPRGRRTIDLYAVIADAPGDVDLALREGERIIVPPVGGTVAVAGDVARPAIYELPPRTAAVPLADMLALAGGTLRAGGNRLLVQQNDAGGRRSYSELAPGSTLRRGDALLVQPGADVAANLVRLSGHVAAPLTRAAAGGPRRQTVR
ncbi:SLBB domain-containing protein, partial [Neoroseomonas rubea]|uniref:SLBB domain-containing protein n=1 Tax=Neoroseomonas rubea TaxID=2748666 RepID=UPI002FCD3D95